MYGYKYIYYRNAANCITQVNFSTPQGGGRGCWLQLISSICISLANSQQHESKNRLGWAADSLFPPNPLPHFSWRESGGYRIKEMDHLLLAELRRCWQVQQLQLKHQKLLQLPPVMHFSCTKRYYLLRELKILRREGYPFPIDLYRYFLSILS